MSRTARTRFFLFGFFCLFVLSLWSQAGAPKTVYILHGINSPGSWQEGFEAELRSLFGAQREFRVELDSEYLGYDPQYPTAHNDTIAAYIAGKMAYSPPDLIIGALAGANAFLDGRREAFGAIPKLMVIPPAPLDAAYRERHRAVGIESVSATAISRTLELIPRLLPGTKRLIVLSGLSAADQYGRNRVKALYEAGNYPYRAEFWDGLMPDEIVAALKDSPRDTALFLVAYEIAHDRQSIITTTVSRELARQLALPLFCYHDSVMGQGVLGGAMTSGAAYAQSCYAAAMEILRGQDPATVQAPVPAISVLFDWAQLQRFGIAESRLPAGSVVLFKPEEPWINFLPYAIAGVAALALQSLLIGLLLASRARRKRTQEALNHTLRHIQSISDNLAEGMIYQVLVSPDQKRRFTYLSQAVKRFYGVSPEAAMADPGLIYGRIHPDDQPSLAAAEAEAITKLSSFSHEARMRNPDGSYRWSQLVSVPTRLDDGTIRWDGIEFVVTQLKQALAEKDKLITELQHRTKNTLQLVEGLLALEAARHPEAPLLQDLVRTTERRVQSLALVQRILLENHQLSLVAMPPFIAELAALGSPGGEAGPAAPCRLNIEPIELLFDTAIPLGLILSELLHYSLQDRRPEAGAVEISLRAADADNHVLEYHDPHPARHDLAQGGDAAGFGLQLIAALGEAQLQGQATLDLGAGMDYRLVFKANLYRPRI